MARNKRHFSREQKLAIVKLIINDNMTVRQVTDLHGIERQTIHRWLNEYKLAGDEHAFLDRAYVTAAQERAKQERLIKELQEEIQILKKAHAYFASLKRK